MTRVAVSGASGLIGSALRASLEADGHQVLPLLRPGRPGHGIAWDPERGTIDARALAGVDAVVHLAGEGVAARPWTQRHRDAVLSSRVDGTTLLATALSGLDRPPHVLVSGSAIGYYGTRGDELLTEASTAGHDFLAAVCVAWEEATAAAQSAGVRTVHVRTGMVLSSRGGALGPQRALFRAGLGARAGRGSQWLSWIHLDDEVGAIRHALEHDGVAGAVNLTAPEPVTNAEFARAFAGSFGRRARLVIPRLATLAPFGVGPLVDSLLFASQRVVPEVLARTGYGFRHPDLGEALASLV